MTNFISNHKPFIMLKKLEEQNEKQIRWTKKKQLKLTKAQHLLILVVGLGLLVFASFKEEGVSKNFLNYFLPFFLSILFGQFSFNALLTGNFKKKNNEN